MWINIHRLQDLKRSEKKFKCHRRDLKKKLSHFFSNSLAPNSCLELMYGCLNGSIYDQFYRVHQNVIHVTTSLCLTFLAEDWSLLACSARRMEKILTFRRKVMPSSSGSSTPRPWKERYYHCRELFSIRQGASFPKIRFFTWPQWHGLFTSTLYILIIEKFWNYEHKDSVSNTLKWDLIVACDWYTNH
jgi:hypothetical protein